MGRPVIRPGDTTREEAVGNILAVNRYVRNIIDVVIRMESEL